MVKSLQMDINPLDIKLVRQNPESYDCLRACALMVFRHFNEPITKQEVWQKLHVYKKHSGLYGGYLSDLGKLAIKRGHKATIYHYATHRWEKDAIEASGKGSKALIKALKEQRKSKSWPTKKLLNKSISFIKLGGKYKVTFPKLDTINEHLVQRIPVILSVRAESFYQNPKSNYSHYILIVGKKNNKYIIRDPYLAVNKVEENELFYSWIRNGGWMMVIFPKKEKLETPKIRQSKLKF